MDIVSLGVLFLLVLGGGASAWVADGLGWRIGKKRHTMFGMRPKHFARLVVTIAGALIPLATIGFLTASSEGVRVWITQGRKAAEELPGVVRQLKDAEAGLTKIQGDTRELRKKNDATIREQRRKIDDSARQVEAQNRLIADQVARIGKLGPQLARLTTEAGRSVAETRRLREANRKVQVALGKTQSAFAKRQEEFRRLQGELAVIKKETDVAKAELTNVKKESNDVNVENLRLTNLSIELGKSITDLRASITGLEEEIGSLRTQRADAQRETESARAERNELRDEVSRLERERRGAEALLRLYQNDQKQTRTESLTFRSGDELARIVVASGASVADASASIEAVLRSARLEAERKGSRPSANPPMRAADLIVGDLKGKPISPAEQVERLATAVAGSAGDTVIVARSLWNIFGEEAVALDLVAFPDPVVFRAGEVVAEGRLDSRRGDEAVYTQINEFLGTRVQERARERKMVPLRTAGEESFGQIEPGQILSVIRTAQKEERVYRLQAIAVGDIRAGDRLRIELRLR